MEHPIAFIAAMGLNIGLLFFIVWAILEWRKMRHKSKLQSQIVDKFSTAKELNDFLQSQEGNTFLKFLKFNGLAPREKIMSSLTRGVILSALGIALIVIGGLLTEEMMYFFSAGIVVIALGAGFLISALISYKLSKKWGIINEER